MFEIELWFQVPSLIQHSHRLYLIGGNGRPTKFINDSHRMTF